MVTLFNILLRWSSTHPFQAISDILDEAFEMLLDKGWDIFVHI